MEEFFRRQDPFNDDLAHTLYQQSLDTVVLATRLTGYYFEEVNIPFESTTLPGYFMRHDQESVPRATIRARTMTVPANFLVVSRRF